MQNSSALKKHFLSSILPHQPLADSQHFLKTKQFYKPEEFIWNNPHRTSKRLYPYYHQANEEYEVKVKPVIEGLEEQDRIMGEQERIRKLIQLRNQARSKFFQRQKFREELEARSNSRRKTSSIAQSQPSTQREPVNPHLQSLKQTLFRTPSTSSHIVANIEKTYKKGLQNYDTSLTQIRNLVNEQMIRNHSKIREKFQKRKEGNDFFNTSVSRVRMGRKSVGVIKAENFADD